MEDKDNLKGKYALIKELQDKVGNYKSPEELNDLLDFMRRFVHLSAFNAFLIHTQNRGSTFVATATQWWDRFNRTIKPGARPMVILWPFGPVRFVYDLSDTEGDDFPRLLLEPFRVEGHIEQCLYDNLINNLSLYGVRYEESNLGSNSGAYIQTNMGQPYIYENNVKMNIYYNLIVSEKLPIESKCRAVIHELGHLFCGHLGEDKTGKKRFKGRTFLEREEKEFEAETVCYLVCSRLGIDPDSARYLRGYTYKNGEMPKIGLDAVIKAVGIIENMISLLIDKQKKLREKWIKERIKDRYNKQG